MDSSKKSLLFIMLCTLMLCGGALIYFTLEYFSHFMQQDSPPNSGTVHQIGLLLLVVTMMAGMPVVGLGAYVMYVGSRIRATGQWPPPGIGLKINIHTHLKDLTNLMGFMAMVLGGTLVVAGLLLPLLGWHLVDEFFKDF